MVTRDELKGQWSEVKGRLKEHWGQLTEEDLRRVEGSAEQLVGVVQQKTGATRREVEQFISNVLESGGQFTGRVTDAAQQYADEASDYMKQNYHRVAGQATDYSARLAETVRSRPNESLAIAFGLGIAAGVLFFFGNRR